MFFSLLIHCITAQCKRHSAKDNPASLCWACCVEWLIFCHADFRYAECHYADFRYADFRGAVYEYNRKLHQIIKTLSCWKFIKSFLILICPLGIFLFFQEKKKKLFVMARYSMLVLFHSLSRKVLPNTLNLPFQASLNNLLYIFKIFLTFFTKQEVNLMRGVIVRGLPPKCKQIPEAFIIFMACV